MKISVMQPYFLPYIGYFQLINTSDIFVIYDNIKYTKKGWINRNRMLNQGKEQKFSLPLKKDSDHLDIKDRWISSTYSREKLLNQFHEAYKKAPYYDFLRPVLETVINYENDNLFDYLFHSINVIAAHLSINTKIIKSSDIPINPSLRSHERVIGLCQALEGKDYINPIGGITLYDRKHFLHEGLRLHFLKSNETIQYDQLNTYHTPWLSIVDILMFVPHQEVKRILDNEYSLL